MSIFFVLCPFGWGYRVGFFGGSNSGVFGESNSDDQLVPSVEMLGGITLTFGWWYRVGFFGGLNSYDELDDVLVSFRSLGEF